MKKWNSFTSPKIVVFTGAGISAESGLGTFRGTDGLWENQRIEDVATFSAWKKDPKNVLHFYNIRREQSRKAKPNAAHITIASLEKQASVFVITQNIDNLHERAGSSHVLHLHGEIEKSRSTVDDSLLYQVQDKIRIGDTCEKGSQLRPHVVWFGESVPLFSDAMQITKTAEVFIIVGTSMLVQPAASLIHLVPQGCKVYCVDPNIESEVVGNATIIQEKATIGVPKLIESLTFS